MIDDYSTELEQLRDEEQQQIDNELISQLEQSVIITDEQWGEFRILFERVHKGFFTSLKARIPDLTPTEVRFLALTKLKLTPREMASMLGTSIGAVRNFRYRLRKKLGMEKDETLDEII